ncbi:MAG: hypothetical protein ABEK59_12090 [Halobacteria archaeon]
MKKLTAATLLLALTLTTSGCIAKETGNTPGVEPNGSSGEKPVKDPGPINKGPGAEPNVDHVYSSTVFDNSPGGGPVVSGGIGNLDVEDTQRRVYVTVLEDKKDLSRLNYGALPEKASEFVNSTGHGESSVVVIQDYPASSFPDYGIEETELSDNTLTLFINDSAEGGTSDITVETMLVRIPDSVTHVQVRNNDGVEFDS